MIKVLVAIAHHGSKNRPYLYRLLHSYRTLSDVEVDVALIVDTPVSLGDDLIYLVGAPTCDPWSLPFRHRSHFAQHLDDYDLFIYSEDDTLIEQRHITAFLDVNRRLPDDAIPGFLRYELHANGQRSYNDIAYGFHWDPMSVLSIGGELYAQHTNPHSAMYMVTRRQLRRVIARGDYLAPPSPGRFDLLVNAASGPYTCGALRKLIPLNRLDDFTLHHLPNRYLGRSGISQQDLDDQVEALAEIAAGERSRRQLIQPNERRPTVRWDKSYHEQLPLSHWQMVRDRSRRVLSVGVGNGDLENPLVEAGVQVTGIPLDEVIAANARRRGIATTTPDIEQALEQLHSERFDEILAINLLQFVQDPADLLRRLGELLSSSGRIVLTVPNLPRAVAQRWMARQSPWIPGIGSVEHGIRWTSARVVAELCEASGLRLVSLGTSTRPGHRVPPPTTRRWLSTDVVAFLQSPPRQKQH